MVYILRNIALIFREIIKNIPKTLISSFGILFLVICAVIFISIRNSVSEYLQKRIFGELKINQIRITPRSPSSFLKISSHEISVDEDKVRKIKNIKGLENIHKVIRLNSPASIKAGMFGMYMKSDIFISGVDRAFFKDTHTNWKKFKKSQYVPIVIPVIVMDIYNNFAASNSLPAIGPKALNMLSIEIIVGSSSFAGKSERESRYEARLFGLTGTITTAGIIVPSDFIINYCKQNPRPAWNTRKCYSCIMLTADVKEIKDIPRITKQIRSMDLNVESHEDIAARTDKAVFVINLVSTAVLGIILILTVISIFNTYLAIAYNRNHIFSIQRMLGASKFRIIFIFILEACIIGFFYGLIGYYSGYYLLIFINKNIPAWLPVIQGINLKLDSHSYLPLALSFSVLVSAASALIPAVFASGLNLFNAVKK